MNKTVTINISGIIFHIEEDAYEKLSKYLSTIKGYFSKTDGGNEIMNDIEARIAEMLQGKTSAVKQVVLMSDVDYVIESMGKPEEFAGDEYSANQEASKNSTSDNEKNTQQENIYNETIKKRLYRDGDSKVLGGVCSGIAHYFDIDVVWVRIALFLLVWLAGLSVLLYLVLWAAIPEAKTVGEKFAMKGEKADINNISKAVKEEAEQLKKRMEKYGQEFSQAAYNHTNVPRSTIEKIIDFISDVLLRVGKAFLKFLGIFLLVFGVIFFLGLSSSVFGLSFLLDSNNGKDWVDMMLLDGKDFSLGLLGIALFAGIPILMMIYTGVKLLFKVKYYNRWVNLSAGIIWFIGFLMVIYVGIRTAKDFSKTAKIRESVTVVPYNTIYIKMQKKDLSTYKINQDDFETDEDVVKIRKKVKRRVYVHNDEYMIAQKNNLKYLLGHAEFNVIKSATDKMELVIVKEAHGVNKEVASQRAKNIIYRAQQIDSTIILDDLFEVINADKFRAQDVKVILKLPVGKTIFLDKNLKNLIYDIENVTNTYDGDMINRRWIMTENGLKCIDCDGLDEESNLNNADEEDSDDLNSSKSKNDDDIKITINGVEIKDNGDNIKIDSNGIQIIDKKDNIKIDKQGIHINTKK